MTLFIAVGSVMGTTDALAKKIIAHCAVRKIQTEFIERINCEAITTADAILVCTSTTGMGDLPASITPLYQQLTEAQPKISGIRCAVIALGDSSYPNFAAAGHRIITALCDCGAAPALLAQIDTSDIDDPWLVVQESFEQWIGQQT